MRANSVNVTIISDKQPTESDTEQIEGIVVRRIPHPMFAPISNRGMLVRSILKDKPDFIVWYGSPLSAMYLSRLKSMGIPLIWDIDVDITSLVTLQKLSFREAFHPHHTFLWQNLMIALIPKQIMRIVANSLFVIKITVPNQSLKLQLLKIGVESSKIEIIPSTIEKDDFDSFLIDEKTDEWKKEIGFENSDFVVTYFGSPCTLRGVDTAILCLLGILKQRKNVKLLILSRTDIATNPANATDWNLKTEENYVKNLITKIGVKKYVEFVSGTIDRKKFCRYLLASDIIVLPFKIVLSEPPLSILESMYLHKVVVTSNIGGLPEIVSPDRGIVIEPCDIKALSKTILFLADHPKTIDCIGESAQRYAESLPSWDDIALKFAEVLNQAKDLL
jgi:glycosyltransferase involved in cell wall biosynthesis